MAHAADVPVAGTAVGAAAVSCAPCQLVSPQDTAGCPSPLRAGCSRMAASVEKGLRPPAGKVKTLQTCGVKEFETNLLTPTLR